MTFGENLKRIRKEQKMSVEELSKKSGLTKVAISNYENDHYLPKPLSIGKLARALNCDYDDLVKTATE